MNTNEKTEAWILILIVDNTRTTIHTKTAEIEMTIRLKAMVASNPRQEQQQNVAETVAMKPQKSKWIGKTEWRATQEGGDSQFLKGYNRKPRAFGCNGAKGKDDCKIRTRVNGTGVTEDYQHRNNDSMKSFLLHYMRQRIGDQMKTQWHESKAEAQQQDGSWSSKRNKSKTRGEHELWSDTCRHHMTPSCLAAFSLCAPTKRQQRYTQRKETIRIPVVNCNWRRVWSTWRSHHEEVTANITASSHIVPLVLPYLNEEANVERITQQREERPTIVQILIIKENKKPKDFNSKREEWDLRSRRAGFGRTHWARCTFGQKLAFHELLNAPHT